jgi:hypothetical protein
MKYLFIGLSPDGGQKTDDEVVQGLFGYVCMNLPTIKVTLILELNAERILILDRFCQRLRVRLWSWYVFIKVPVV